MERSFGSLGYEEGRSVVVAKAITVDESDFPSEEQSAEMRRIAEEEMVNIGVYERERRRVVGKIGLTAAAVFAVWASLVDQNDAFGHFTRLAVVFPLFVGEGYKRSAEAGL